MKYFFLLFFFFCNSSFCKDNQTTLAPSSSLQSGHEAYDLNAENTTSFYRDFPSLFDYCFRKAFEIALESKKRTKDSSPIRIHSAGGSDFSEAYSISMFCHKQQKGFQRIYPHFDPQHDLKVLVSEINPNAVAIGEAAIYRYEKLIVDVMSLYGPEDIVVHTDHFLEQYFTSTDETNELWKVKDKFRQNIQSMGVTDLSKNPHPANLDIIFFNNIWSKTNYSGTSEYKSMCEKMLDSLKSGGLIISNNTWLRAYRPKVGILQTISHRDGYHIYQYTRDSSPSLNQISSTQRAS